MSWYIVLLYIFMSFLLKYKQRKKWTAALHTISLNKSKEKYEKKWNGMNMCVSKLGFYCCIHNHKYYDMLVHFLMNVLILLHLLPCSCLHSWTCILHQRASHQSESGHTSTGKSYYLKFGFSCSCYLEFFLYQTIHQYSFWSYSIGCPLKQYLKSSSFTQISFTI